MQWTTSETLTTTVDHNDIRLRSIEPDGGKSNPQVNDSNRHRAGSLQARGCWFDPSCTRQACSEGGMPRTATFGSPHRWSTTALLF